MNVVGALEVVTLLPTTEVCGCALREKINVSDYDRCKAEHWAFLLMFAGGLLLAIAMIIKIIRR